jgi:multicomponent Na+:H+ antiporter subunit E
MSNRWIVWILLLAAYLALSANLEWRNVIFGLLISGGITSLLPLRSRQMRLYHLPAVLLAVLHYLVILIWETIKSGLDVVYLVLHREMPINPAVIRIPAMGDNRFGISLSAHSLTLAPGEMVIAIDDHHNLYTHVINAKLDEEGNLEMPYRRFKLLWRVIALAFRPGEQK